MGVCNLFDDRFMQKSTITQWRPGFHLNAMLLAEVDNGWLVNLGIKLDLIDGRRNFGMIQ